MSKNILLVEGDTDKIFFDEFLKTLNLTVQVKVGLPRDLGGTHNSKGGICNLLPDLIAQLSDEDAVLKKLAIIVDADSLPHSNCQKTIERISKIIESFEYMLVVEKSNGFFYKNSDGLPSIGLWIMPDNENEGMLEDWIKASIHPNEQILLTQVKTVIDSLDPKKFKPIHRSKAEVATWLAWQEQPGHGLYWAAHSKNNLLDAGSSPYAELVDWLKRVYVEEK
ncbi:MAG: hypothetical protein RLZZ66_2440 [Pseudomonadota bacterium]